MMLDKNKAMMIAIIILLVVLLVTIGVGFFITFKNLDKSSAPKDEKPTAVDQNNISLVTADEIITNLRVGADEKTHTIKVKISLGIDTSDKKNSEEFITMLGEKDLVVSDVILGVLRNKTYEELNKGDAQEILRDEILGKLQQQFNTNLIVTVYVSDLFLQ